MSEVSKVARKLLLCIILAGPSCRALGPTDFPYAQYEAVPENGSIAPMYNGWVLVPLHLVDNYLQGMPGMIGPKWVGP